MTGKTAIAGQTKTAIENRTDRFLEDAELDAVTRGWMINFGSQGAGAAVFGRSEVRTATTARSVSL